MINIVTTYSTINTNSYNQILFNIHYNLFQHIAKL